MTSQPTASALQFLYGIFDGTLTSEEVDAIVGVSPDSRSLDVSVGMEVVLAWLDADFELETASSMSSSSSLDDDGGALSQLKALCPHRDSHTLNRVLSSCGGDVDRAADRLFAATGGSEEDEKTVRVQVKGTSVRGREADADSVCAIFPALSFHDALALVNTHGGLHNAIAILTGEDPPHVHPSKRKTHHKHSLHPSASYSSITTAVANAETRLPHKITFSGTQTTLNPHIPREETVDTLLKQESGTENMTVADILALGSEFCRAKAHEHAQKRGEAFQLAAAEFKRGSITGRGSAQYYSEIGHSHTAFIELWNSRAAKCITHQNTTSHNNELTVLDLHGLTKAEAIWTLSERLATYFAPVPAGSRAGPPPLKVITGIGVHSGKRKAVLLPATLSYLKSHGWRHEYEANLGQIIVKGKVF